MSYEAVNFCCEIGVVVSSVALGDVVLVGIQDDVIEGGNMFVEVINGCAVQNAKVMFCFLFEACPVCSFVVCVCNRWIVSFGI